jgi:hypothetical protein
MKTVDLCIQHFKPLKYAGHKKSLDSIETAYDKIIMESFRDRRKLKSNPASELKKVRESPAWVRKLGSMTEVPSPKVIALRTVFYILLGIWSVFDSADGGPAFQVRIPSQRRGLLNLNLSSRRKVNWWVGKFRFYIGLHVLQL